MGDLDPPKLMCVQTGAVIELNSNPFSIGRGLSCNYVIIKKAVSRVHCVLEKEEDNWILRDTSTNGTLVNDKLHKAVKSPPLKAGDIIKFDQEGDSFVFQMGRENRSDDISDEQLCRIADSVLDGVEAFQQETRHRDNNEQFSSGNESENILKVGDILVATSAALQDHLGMAKRTDAPLCKKQKIDTGPSTAATTANCTNDRGASTTNAEVGTSNAPSTAPLVDLTSTSDGSSVSILVEKPEATAAIAGPLEVMTTNVNQVRSSQAVIDQQDTYEVMENELQCAICSELFVKAVTLQCCHTFCKYCIEMWKKNKSDCPICRKKITGMTPTLVLDNVIEKVIESSSEETKQRRKEMLKERQAAENAKAKPPKQTTTTTTTRGRGRGRGRGGRVGRRGNSPTVLFGVVGDAEQMGSIPEPVIEVSSDSNSDWDDFTDSNSDDTAEWQDEYDNDDWYDGLPGNYYGGYGHCFRCGRRGHWANGCPY